MRRGPTFALVAAAIAVGGVLIIVSQEPDRNLETSLADPDPAPPASRPSPPGAGGQPGSPTSTDEANARVRIDVGEDIQSIVASHPPGTTFLIGAGIHRLQEIRPRDGDRFVGEPGATLSGARLLSPEEFRRDSDDRWVIDGQTQQGFVHGSMEPGRERDAHPEDLYGDGRRLRHVDSRSAVGEADEWFLDYDHDQIVLAEDPRNFHRLEAAAAEFAFAGEGVRDVTIENLTVRHYANWAQRGAINGRGSIAWTIRHVEASHNHALGLGIGPGMLVEHSRFAHNGQLGIGGTAGAADDDGAAGQDVRPVAIRSNEITTNGELGYRWRWEGGGTKFVDTEGLVIANNLVTANDGPGLWYDIDNVDTIVCANRVEDNVVGIFAEISYGTRIAWNLVWNNVRAGEEEASIGIHVSGTSDAEVFANVVAGHHAGIFGKENERGEGRLGRYGTTGLDVHDNVVADHVFSGLVVETGREEPFETARFAGNRWLVDDTDARQWEWRGRLLSWEDWQAAGMDASGEVVPVENAEAALSHGAPRFTVTSYGPLGTGRSAPAPPDAAHCAQRMPS